MTFIILLLALHLSSHWMDYFTAKIKNFSTIIFGPMALILTFYGLIHSRELSTVCNTKGIVTNGFNKVCIFILVSSLCIGMLVTHSLMM